ncbi:MAG: hypothetical protein ACREOD_07335 [Candidatus Dormibacteria bacterium]
MTLLHPADGQLRRLVDEPLLVPDRIRVHVPACPRCQGRYQRYRQEAAGTRRLLESAPAPVVDSGAALQALRRRLAQTDPASAPRPAMRRWARPGRPASVAALVALLAIAGGTGGALAGVHWTQIFAPAQVTAVPVTRSELLELPHLADFGQLSHSGELRLVPETSLAAAEAAAGVTLALPASLPQGVSGPPSLYLVPRLSATFTFSAARAQAAAQAAGVGLPALPPGFDGTQLRETVGPGILAVYGSRSGSAVNLARVIRQLGLGGSQSRRRVAGAGGAGSGASPRPSPGGDQGAGLEDLPTLALMAVQPPRLDSTGVTVAQLESYLLSLPFLPPSLASAIHQLGDPITSLPIPVLPQLGPSQPTTVDGARAVLFGSASPLLAAVVWEQRGTVRAVGGLLDQGTVLDLARG